MEKYIKKIQTLMMPLANKLSTFQFLNALGRTFQILLPIIIIGSFAALGAFIDIPAWQSFIANNGMGTIFMTVQSVTLSIIALYVLVVLSYIYANELKINATSASMLAVMAFLILTPTELYTSIPTEWLGYQGLLGVMIVSGLVPLLYKFLLDKNIYIKMPKGVPSIVEDSFGSIIPAFVIIVITVTFSQIIGKTSFGNFHNIVYSLIQQPLTGIGLSYPSYLFIALLSSLLMFCGIHGSVISGLLIPLTMAAGAENLVALAAGEPLPNIITTSFQLFTMPGGFGGTLGLTFLLLFSARSKRLKSLGKISFVPAVFGINEPLIFGVPILLNPLLLIPYLLTPIICISVSYFSILSGLVPRLSGVEVNWTIPPVISGFLAQGWQAAILQVFLILITIVVWYPFFKIIDRQAVAEEEISIDK